MKRTYSTFSEDAYKVLDYTRCQRPDGTFYGTSGQCRKGTQVGAKEKTKSKNAAPKKPTDFEKGASLTEGSLETLQKDSEWLRKQLANAREALKKDPDDDFTKTVVERYENQLKPFEASQKLLEGIVADSPKGTQVIVTPMGYIRTEFKTPGGNVVSTTFGRSSFNFQVNDSYDAGSVTTRQEQMAVARQVQRVFQAHTRSLPENFVIQTSAHTDDGRGASRQRAYERMGFSKAKPGNSIYGRKEGNRIVPSNRAEEGLSSTALSFAETNSNIETALWYLAIFGESEKKEDFSETLDFTRCQRPDGSFYGTSGQCRKGTPVGPREIKALKKAAASGNKKAKAALNVVEGKKTKAQAVKELGGEATKKGAPTAKPKGKSKKKAKPDLQTQYAGLAKQAQEAMAKGDMDKALRLNQEAMTIMSKIKSQEEKGSPEVKKRKEKVEKVMEGLKKAGSSNVTKDSEGAYITDKVGSNEVKTLITPKTDGSYEIGYKVNDSYTKGGVTDRREQVRVALTAKRQFDSALSAFPDGTKIRAFAYDDDGGGDTRRKAYEKLGFKHQGNNVMTGLVSGGKIEGTDFAEKMSSEEKLWVRIIFANEAGKNSQRGA